MRTIHLRINDAATGQPTPVRLHITDDAGRAYPPLGRPAEFAVGSGEDVGGHLCLGRERWWQVDGSVEVPLPDGVPLVIEASKGPAYLPLRHRFTLGSGQMAVRLAITRLPGWDAPEWVAGDARAHVVPPHLALLEGRAEGLAVVNLLARVVYAPSLDGQTYATVPNLLAFSGAEALVTTADALVAVNTLNRHSHLGTLGLLATHRVVHPLAFGAPDDTDDWSLTDWCQQAHRKRGLVVWADISAEQGQGGEALALALLGHVDAIEVSPAHGPALRWWQALAQVGCPLPLVGASGKTSNRVPLGAVRTYARLPADTPLTYRAWIEAVRAGQTFVTNGPLMRLRVADDEPGGQIETPAGTLLPIHAEAVSATPFAALQVLHNGTPIATARAADGRATVMLPWPATSGWLAARCVGTEAFAHTSAVRVQVGASAPVDATAAETLRAYLRKTVDWVERVGRFDKPAARTQLLDTLAQAMARLDAPM